MPEPQEPPFKCRHCGHVHATAVAHCDACGAAMDAVTGAAATEEDDGSALSRSLKLRWVAAVMAFWVSAAVLAVVYFIQGRLSIVLMSICLGLLVVGIWLKASYQRQLRNGPGGL